MFVRIVALFTVLFLVPPSYAEVMNADEKAVWALEEAYYVYVVNNDIEGYLTLWDERFVGWPGGDLKPAYKSNITDWIVKYHKDPKIRLSYENTRMAVRSFGDVVVAHYVSTAYGVNIETGHSEKFYTAKITHTWLRRGDTWQIITGMAGEYPPDE